jgi:hypothetical protein
MLKFYFLFGDLRRVSILVHTIEWIICESAKAISKTSVFYSRPLDHWVLVTYMYHYPDFGIFC